MNRISSDFQGLLLRFAISKVDEYLCEWWDLNEFCSRLSLHHQAYKGIQAADSSVDTEQIDNHTSRDSIDTYII